MKPRGAIPLILMIVTFATFGRIVAHEFTGWDDAMTIFENPRIVSPSLRNVGHYWTHSEGGLYIPVTYTLWSAIAAVSQVNDGAEHVALNPWAFHAVSLILHSISVLVVLKILRLLIAQEFAAMFGALLFAVHPLQVETVGWTSGAKDLLGGLFSLVCIWQYVMYARMKSSTAFQPVQSDSKEMIHGLETRATPMVSVARRHLVLAAVGLVIAMLSKPSAVVAPLIAGVIDRILFRRAFDRVLASVLPLLALTIPIVLIARAVQTAPHVTDAPTWTRPLVALDALTFYIHKLIWPATLGIIYGRTPDAILKSGAIYYTWTVPVLSAALGFSLRKRWPTLLCAEAIFALALLPVLGLTPFMFQVHSTVADHYMYVAMLGPAMLLASAIRAQPSRWAQMAAVMLLTALAIRSAIQAGTWKNSVTLAAHAAQVCPTSATAQSNLGIALAADNRINDALPHLEAAVRLDAHNHNAHSALAQAYLQLGRPRDAFDEAQVAIHLVETEPLTPDERPDRSKRIRDLAVHELFREEQAKRRSEGAPSSQP